VPTFYALGETRRPVNQMCVPRGAFVYASEAIKRVARVPV
jgi:hypothetical protein